MKKIIAVSIITLITIIMCCGCTYTSANSEIDNNYVPSYEYEFEYDITYKKDTDDLSPTVYITEYGRRYHRFGCNHAKDPYMKLTVRQAIDRGYSCCYFCCN